MDLPGAALLDRAPCAEAVHGDFGFDIEPSSGRTSRSSQGDTCSIQPPLVGGSRNTPSKRCDVDCANLTASPRMISTAPPVGSLPPVQCVERARRARPGRRARRRGGGLEARGCRCRRRGPGRLRPSRSQPVEQGLAHAVGAGAGWHRGTSSRRERHCPPTMRTRLTARLPRGAGRTRHAADGRRRRRRRSR